MQYQELLARFEEYMVGLGMAPATIANYVADVQNFALWFADLTAECLSKANASHVRHYCQSLRRQGRSKSTVNRRLQAVRKFYDFLSQVGLSTDNPARDVERVDEHSDTSPRILSADEVNKLLQISREGIDGLARRDHAVLLLLLDTGIKVRELVDLRLEDLDLNVGTGYIWVGDNLLSGGRGLSLGSETCAALRTYLRVRASAPGVDNLFVSRQGQSLSVRTVQRLVASYAHAAGLEGVSAQTLRYTFAHDALDKRDVSEVARMLGLRDADGVRRYTDL